MNATEIEAIPLDIENAFGDLQSRIMSDIVRRIEINGSVTRSADWQITRLKQLGESDQTIKKAIQDTLKLSDKAINDIYAEAIQSEYIRTADVYKLSGNTLIPFADNIELQSVIEAVRKQTMDELVNITRSLGFVTQQGGKLKALDITAFYQKTLDAALGDITSGSFSYNEALRRTVKDMTNSGLRWIDYDTGYHNRVNVAARRAVMTGFNQTVRHMNDKTARDLGTNSFEVTWHAGARPDHMTWQGRVYTKKQLSEICGLGSVAGLKGANCYHDYLAFVPGASVRTYTDAQLEKMNNDEMTPKTYNGREYTSYEARQRQRQLETNMRAQMQEISLLKQGGGDPIDIQNAMSRYRGSSAEYTGLSKAMKLPQQRERVTIDGLGKVTGKTAGSSTPAAITKAQKPLFVPAKTIDESAEYAKNTLGFEVVKYGKTDLKVANTINRTILDIQSKYPEINVDRIVDSPRSANYQLAMHKTNYVPQKGVTAGTLELGSFEWHSYDETSSTVRRYIESKYLAGNIDMPLEGIIWHEYGHQYGTILEAKAFPDIDNDFIKYSKYVQKKQYFKELLKQSKEQAKKEGWDFKTANISGCALKSESEAFAEAFQDINVNKNPTRESILLMKIAGII